MELWRRNALVVFIEDVVSYLLDSSVRTNIEFEKFESFLADRTITFYNWECPIRSELKPSGSSDLELECDFFDSEDAINRTRLVQFESLERKFVNNVLIPFRKLGFNVKYYKFLADLNSKLLYPETINTSKKRKTVERTIYSFYRRLQERANFIVGSGNIDIIPFSQVYGMFNEEYDKIFRSVYYSFEDESNGLSTKYLPPKIVRNELQELIKHSGLEVDDKNLGLNELGKRVIASYSAEEGVIRECLSRESWFRNPVAIPNESMFTFPILANAYIGQKNRGPWLFCMYDGGKI